MFDKIAILPAKYPKDRDGDRPTKVPSAGLYLFYQLVKEEKAQYEPN
jgi:hypothetical protein